MGYGAIETAQKRTMKIRWLLFHCGLRRRRHRRRLNQWNRTHRLNKPQTRLFSLPLPLPLPLPLQCPSVLLRLHVPCRPLLIGGGNSKVEMHAVVRKSVPVVRSPLSPAAHIAPFHSTPISLAKWKSKWNCKDEGKSQQPSKTYMKYAIRQRRADAKKALKDFLLYGKSPNQHLEDEGLGRRPNKTGRRKAKIEYSAHDVHEDGEKSEPHFSFSGNSKHAGSKRRQNKHSSYYEDDYVPHERIFQAFFSGYSGFTWSFASWEDSHFNYSRTGFEWRDEVKREKGQRRVWSESDIEDEVTDVGSHSDRLILGLPPTGPLKLDDVKCAFRAAALKWHPDKHQGPSQAMAEEKFKLCVDAYSSLCNVLKSN